MFVEIILSDFAVKDLLSRRSISNEGDVIFVYEPDREPISPNDLSFKPRVLAEFAKDARLGFVYGKGSGCAFIRKKALEKTLSFADKKKLRIVCCEDLLVVLKDRRFKIKQVDYFALDLLNIRSTPEGHPMLVALDGSYEAPPHDMLDRFLEFRIRQGALKILHRDYLRFGPV